MLGSLRGKITLKAKSYIIMEVNNIGYRIFVPASLMPTLTDSQEYCFYIHQQVKEDAHVLFGFPNFDQLELFEALITVSGVGPKSALSIINLAPTSQLSMAIKQENIGFISTADGIGKKTAAKIILDLKTKVDNIQTESAIFPSEEGVDLVSALESLGYSKPSIRSIIVDIDTSLTLEQQLKIALQTIGK
ncbi:MAG: Holliday junction branch migration protein RuvA [bacterium]